MKQDPQDRTGTKDILCGTSERDPLYVTEQYHGNPWTEPHMVPQDKNLEWDGTRPTGWDGTAGTGQDGIPQHGTLGWDRSPGKGRD